MSIPWDALQTQTHHATCIVLGEKGVLIRGASGCGKSTLALALMQRAHQQHQFAQLVCDDRVRLSVLGENATQKRVLALHIPVIKGLIEVRGLGLIEHPNLPIARITHVVELVCEDKSTELNRLPTPEERHTELLGVRLPYLKTVFCDHALIKVDRFLKQTSQDMWIHP
jgi:HPr kinase/phosphorylase